MTWKCDKETEITEFIGTYKFEDKLYKLSGNEAN